MCKEKSTFLKVFTEKHEVFNIFLTLLFNTFCFNNITVSQHNRVQC